MMPVTLRPRQRACQADCPDAASYSDCTIDEICSAAVGGYVCGENRYLSTCAFRSLAVLLVLIRRKPFGSTPAGFPFCLT